MALELVTPPVVEPISLSEAKLHLRVDVPDDDAYITSLIVAARQQAESITRRAFVTQTYKLTMDAFPCGPIYLPRPPLQSVSSITYVDTAGVTQTWSASDYQVEATGGPFAPPGRVAPAYGQSYPATRAVFGAVTITFVAGYGSQASDVPQAIRQAILLVLGHWYEHRELAVVGTSVVELPRSAEWLLSPYRVLDERVSV